MKRYFVFFASALLVLVSFSGCGEVDRLGNQSDVTTSATSSTDNQPVLIVSQEIWEQTFSEDGLVALLENYTVTNLLDEGHWDTAVTPTRVSRLSKSDADELRAGAILANGDNCVIQFIFNKETGWKQGIYDETDTVEQYVEEITQEMIQTLQVLSGKFENVVWDDKQCAYVIDIEIPYNGPSLADPSLETTTLRTFEVFFIDGNLSKINIIEGESLSVVHSFGSTPIPQLPDA